MIKASMKIAMAMLAGRQVWPNIEGYYVLSGGEEIGDVWIYSTVDVGESRDPANRLGKFFRKRHAPCKALVEPKGGDGQPADVTRFLKRCIQERSADRYIFNATGGTKMMSAGMLRFVGEPNISVYYREISSGWFEVVRGSDGRSLETVPLETNLHATDAIPVEDLVRLQAGIPDEAVLESESASDLPVLELLKAAEAKNWDWGHAFRALNLPAKEKAGFLFEKFTAAALRALGATNVVLNLKTRGADNKALDETDVVCNFSGRLAIVDCKLSGPNEIKAGREDSLLKQIQKKANIKQTLGGTKAGMLFLRPNIDTDEAEQALAKSCGILLLDREGCFGFFRALAQFIGAPELSGIVADAQSFLDNLKNHGATHVFSNPRFSDKRVAKALHDSPIIDLGKLCAGVRQGLLQDWACWQVAETAGVSEIAIRVHSSSSETNWESHSQRVFNALSSSAHIQNLGTSNDRTRWQISLLVTKDQKEPLEDFLNSRIGKPLLQLP